MLAFFKAYGSDSVNLSSVDSINSTPVDSVDPEIQEESFQDDMNSLFQNYSDSIDTTGWCNSKINTVWFDYRLMTDTIRIPLIDSSCNRLFTFPCPGEVTSPFGPRRQFWHFGMDTRLKKGDTVRCAFNGKVRVIQNDRYGYGKVIVVRHHSGVETIYGHLSKPLVITDQELRSGDPVGLGGNTGRSTGAHLHFEIRYRGEPFNPLAIIDFERFVLLSDTLVLTKADFDYLTEVRKTVYHKIRKGETLGHIARKYGTSVSKLCALNGISRRTILCIGRRMVVRKSKTPDAELMKRVNAGKPVDIGNSADSTSAGIVPEIKSN
jgi:hypothetical protein